MDDYITNTLSKLADDVSEIKVSVAVSHALHEKNSQDLEYHIKRTDLLEKKVEVIQSWWVITGKILVVLIPLITLVLKITGVI